MIVSLLTVFLLVAIKIEQIEANESKLMPVEPLIEFMRKGRDKDSEAEMESKYPYQEENQDFPEVKTIQHINRIIKHKKTKNMKPKKIKKLNRQFKTQKSHKKEVIKKKWIRKSDKDSNMSESREGILKGAPVDIVVHIKMNE